MKSPETISNKSLPNLIIAGVNKAGTTSLFTYLKLHSDICGSKVKETCFFLPLRYGGVLPPIEQYFDYFDQCSQSHLYIIESTPGYFYGGKKVAESINNHLGDVKILIILRDPVTRLISFFKSKKSHMELAPNQSIDDYIVACENIPPRERTKQENNVYWGIEGGCYIEYLPDWLEVFGDKVRIEFFENLLTDRRKLLIGICDWLQIDASVYETLEMSIENKSVNYRNRFFQQIALYLNTQGEAFWRSHPYLKRHLRKLYYLINGKPFTEEASIETQDYLCSLFRPYNKRLARELLRCGYRDLPDWVTTEPCTNN